MLPLRPNQGFSTIVFGSIFHHPARRTHTAMIPDTELQLLLSMVERAYDLARNGDLADGHAQLVWGIQTARLCAREGADWANDLVERYREAIESYCDRWGVRMR